MCGHARSAVEKYTDLAKIQTKDLRMVATPCLDDSQLSQEDFDNKGRLHDIAAQVVLTCLYLARHNRPDILWSVNHLARHVTKWSQADDKRLQRLISYLHHTQHYVQQCVAGDYITDCLLVMYVDAGYAGDLGDSKSTGGAIIYLLGPNTCVPLAWVCKKQGAVSHSSTEAEIISLEMAIRMVGYPLLQLWDEILAVMTKAKRRTPDPELRRLNSLEAISNSIDHVPTTCPEPGNGKLVVLEDNDAVIKMLMKGRSDKMRHVPRTHRINLDWLLCQMRVDPGLRTKHISTKNQLADMFTKGIFAIPQWNHLLRLSGIVPSKQQTVQLLGQPNQKQQLGQQLGQQKAAGVVGATQPKTKRSPWEFYAGFWRGKCATRMKAEETQPCQKEEQC